MYILNNMLLYFLKFILNFIKIRFLFFENVYLELFICKNNLNKIL